MMAEVIEKCEKESKDEDPPDLVPDKLPKDISNMWEIPQMYEFLCLTKDTLHIQHLSMYEMERMLLMPRVSKQLANIMTCLLCPSMPKSKFKQIPPMPYEFWSKFLLTHKVNNWFKIYQSKECNPVKVLDLIGVEPEFWKIFPVSTTFDEGFEALNFRQRIWLLKTVCDTLMHSKRSLIEEVTRKFLDGEGEKFLGRDRHGARYIYFPIFLDGDLRVYKHNLNNKILLHVTPIAAKLKLQVVQTRKRRRERRKSNRWKNGNLPLKSKKRVVRPLKLNSALECKIKIETSEEKFDNTEYQKNDIKLDDNDDLVSITQNNDTVISTINLNLPEDDGLMPPDDVSNSSKTDDEKINEIMATTSTNVVENNNHVRSKSDDEKLIETKTVVDNEKEQPTDNNDYLKDEIGLNSWMKALPEKINYEENADESLDDMDDITKINKSVSQKDIEDFNSVLTDLSVSAFELVADSVESLTELVNSLSAQNSTPTTEPIRCEILLINKINALIDSLKPKEAIIIESNKKSREKLKNEWRKFHNGINEDNNFLDDGSRGSNEWVIGSQGCPLFSYGDSSHNDPLQQDDDVHEKDKELGEKFHENIDNNSIKSAIEPRRVLRARGVSSYTEQFTSEEESESSEGEGWSETVDPMTGMHLDLSSIPSSTRDRPIGEESGNTDSDQDWILPTPRKRKNKRISASRRLKSFQNKLQNIKVDPTLSEPAVRLTTNEMRLQINNVISNNCSQNSLNDIKIESVHSEIDIKDEGPIIDNQVVNDRASSNCGVQQNYVLVNSTNGTMNYVMVPNENPTPPIHITPPSYYVQGPHGYYLPGPQVHTQVRSYGQSSNYQALHPMIIQQNTHQFASPASYVQYQMGLVSTGPLYSTAGQNPTLTQPITATSQIIRGPRIVQNKQIVPPRHPEGAVIRSTVPFQTSAKQSGGIRGRAIYPRNLVEPRNIRPAKMNIKSPPNTTKTTSLIVLSDSDDEIEMIIPEKYDNSQGNKNNHIVQMVNEKQTVNRNIVITSTASAGQSSTSKGGLSPQIIQRMSQGGISITPVKPRSPVLTPPISATQLVVVVNETGNHYALALPNGSKLILTPEQVAQIRASNGGQLSV